MGEQWINLSERDRRRLAVVRRVAAGELSVKQAAEELDVSERQMFRIVAAYRERRLAGLAHGNRGRRPRTRVPDEVRARVAELARTKYAGESQQSLQRLLAENEGIKVSRSTVRNILLEARLTPEGGALAPGPRLRSDHSSQQAPERKRGTQASNGHPHPRGGGFMVNFQVRRTDIIA
jgi:transposase